MEVRDDQGSVRQTQVLVEYNVLPSSRKEEKGKVWTEIEDGFSFHRGTERI